MISEPRLNLMKCVVKLQGRPVLDSYIVQGILVETSYVNDKWLSFHDCSIAVFKCSMAGDCTDSVINTDHLEVDSMLDIDGIMIDRMLETVNTLINVYSVGIIVCQKVRIYLLQLRTAVAHIYFVCLCYYLSDVANSSHIDY